jgi:glycosyltransferase involved in cell wall biosynthesis
MRIAMVGPFGLHPNQTMHIRALNPARVLARRGHEVTLFMPPWQTPAESDRRWQEEGVAIRYVPLRGGVTGIARRLVEEVLAWRPDVVHCFKPKAYSGLVAWWLWQAHRHRLRLVVDTDDWEGWGGWNELAAYTPLQKQFFAWQEQWGLDHCHALTVASRTLQSLAWSRGVAPERVFYVPNGPGIGAQYAVKSEQYTVNSEQYVLARAEKRRELRLGERPVVLLYSRLFEFDTARLVAVLRGVKRAVRSVAVLMVGAGLYEADAAQFRQQLAATGSGVAVVDVGWVELAALPALLAAADVGIYLMDDTLLNRTKCPVKLADMLHVGLPVVAEAVGQVPEYVVQGRTGLLRPSGDVAGLTADLVHLLQDGGEREKLAAGAKAHVAEHFSWPKLARIFERAYGA